MTPQRQSRPAALGMCLLNLAVPGAGYAAAGDLARGALLFLLLNACFAAGLTYEGYVLVPAFDPRHPAFNIVGLLTFIVQCFDAGGTGLVLLAERMGGPLARLLVRDPGGAYSDLGAFHLLVAGGLNYFSTVRLFDLLTGADTHEVLETAGKPASGNPAGEAAP